METPLPEAFDWAETVASLVPEWHPCRGKEIKVALIDTGVNFDVPSLGHLNIRGHKFFTGNFGFNPFDKKGTDEVKDSFAAVGGHGTQYAGLLAGEPNPTKRGVLAGMINACDLFIVKAKESNSEVTRIRHLLDAFELCVELGVEIAIVPLKVRVSSKRDEGIDEAQIDRVMKRVVDANLHIFTVIQNLTTGEDWTDIVEKNFPSERPEVINVAVLPQEDLEEVRPAIESQHIDFLLGGFNGWVYDTNGHLIPLRFTNSGAAAIMGGIAALCLGSLRQQELPHKISRQDLLERLQSCAQPLENATGNDPQPVIFFNSRRP